MKQKETFRITIVLLFTVLFLLIIYKRETVGINFKVQPVQFFQKTEEKRSRFVPYVIPSDEELDKSNNWTDLIAIAHRYSDHMDVLCSQQERIGTVFDGGKNLCVEGSIKPRFNDCLVYSFGSHNEFSFEIDATKLFGCEVHTFDPYATGYNVPWFITYYRIGLGPKDEIREKGRKFLTFKSIIDRLNHSKRVIDILKVDIEMAEWAFLENVLSGDMLQNHVKQISIEMHFPTKPDMEPNLNLILKLLRRLNESGFLTFSRERNSFCTSCTFYVPELTLYFCSLTEFSLLNDRFL